MLLDLKPLLSAYFEATNAHDADAVAALFSEDAIVHDEKVDHHGRNAIRDWAESTYRRYDVRLMPGNFIEEEGVTTVPTRVAGSFLGSPINLAFRFVTDGDRIRELRIG